MWEWHGYGLGHGFMWVFWLLVIVVLLVFVRAGKEGNPKRSPESALEILQKRYARGEIDEAEYERRRKTLEQ